MSAPQLGNDSLNLETILTTAWPWTNELDDVTNDAVYGADLCGPIEYGIFTPGATLATKTPSTLVTRTGDVLNFSPGLIPIGQYDLLLCGRLTGAYSAVEKCELFQVRVTPCRTTIVPPATSPSDMSSFWYSSASSQNIGGVLSGYTQ